MTLSPPQSLCRLASSLLLAGACLTASAALSTYEGFGYANGSNLNGASGGSGFSATWLATAGANATGTGLSFANLPAGTAGAVSVGNASRDNTYRTFANRSGTDTWIAFLFRRDSNSNGDCNVVVGSGASSVWVATGTGGIRIGSNGPTSRLSIAPASDFAIGVNDPVTDTAAIGLTRLIVLHLDYTSANSGTVNVYLDPNPSQALGSPNYSNGFTLGALDRVALNGNTGFTVDEIRVGDIYQDVIGNNDPDGDLLTTELEATLGTNPLSVDSDSDGFNDATEHLNGTNPASAASVPGATRIERVLGFGAARGLDLTGNFPYAFNVGPAGAAGQAGDAIFTADNAAGITVQAPNNPIAVWNNPNFGSTAADNVLETVYQSIRWADHQWGAPDQTFRVNLANLTVGRAYKLQLLFGEAGSTGRRFDVSVNGALIVNDFAPTTAQGSAYATTAGSAVVHEFTATSTTLNIVLDGVTDVASVPGLNRDSYLNGATLELLPTALDSWRTQTGLASNGSQDLANPSGDGVPNLLKFAFKLAQNSGDLATANRAVLAPGGTSGLPNIAPDSQGRLVVSFVRMKASANSGLTYTVEGTNDLSAAWQPLDITGATVTSIDATWERVTYTDSTPVTTPRFRRVSVSAIP